MNSNKKQLIDIYGRRIINNNLDINFYLSCLNQRKIYNNNANKIYLLNVKNEQIIGLSNCNYTGSNNLIVIVHTDVTAAAAPRVASGHLRLPCTS